MGVVAKKLHPCVYHTGVKVNLLPDDASGAIWNYLIPINSIVQSKPTLR